MTLKQFSYETFFLCTPVSRPCSKYDIQFQETSLSLCEMWGVQSGVIPVLFFCDGCDEWTRLSCLTISAREYRLSIITGAEIFHTCNRCILLAQPLFGDVEEDRKSKKEEDSVFFHRCLTLNFLTVSNLKVCIFYILMLGAYYLKLKNFA